MVPASLTLGSPLGLALTNGTVADLLEAEAWKRASSLGYAWVGVLEGKMHGRESVVLVEAIVDQPAVAR